VRALTQMGLSGDFSRLDGNQAKRHHFLPQFLLRGFAQERGGKERLLQMETAEPRRTEAGGPPSRSLPSPSVHGHR
jgi:hypothetical protein